MPSTFKDRNGYRALAALAVCLALAAGASTPGVATPVPLERTEPSPDLRADYTVYVGGLIVAEGSMSATLEGEDYFLKNELGSAGLPGKFWNARWTMTSEGRIVDDALRPSRFAFSAWEKNETKKREILYDDRGVPTLSFDPPLPEAEIEKTPPDERRNTLDPVSAFLLPVVADGNPCDRSIPVFDGKRRYDLHLVFDREDELTTRDNGYSGVAIRCKVRVQPRTGLDRAKLTTMLQRRDDTFIWLAPVSGGRLYIPVRVQMRTPVGGAVLDVVKLRRYAAKNVSAAATAAE
ncbi:MAG: DUF3108 domain-containing protein [Parvibaculaceae bacterium]